VPFFFIYSPPFCFFFHSTSSFFSSSFLDPPYLPLLSLIRVKLEAFLRQLVLARLQDCSLPQKAQVATSTLPELTLEAPTIADMCVGLEAESAITLNKLKQSVQFGGGGARSSRGAGDSSSSMGEAAGGGAGDDEDGDYEGGEGGGGGSGGSSLPPLVYTEAAYFHPCGGWSRVKSGRRDVFRKDGVVPDVEVRDKRAILGGSCAECCRK
jgi:hypothetical protein